MIRLLLTMIFLFPLFLSAETIVVKTKAPQNRNAVFQYRVPQGYDKNRQEMYRVLVIFGGRNWQGRSVRASVQKNSNSHYQHYGKTRKRCLI